MTGTEFEAHCAKILRKKGFKKIELTKASGDQGIDIIARKHRKKYGIQCKLYEYPVGNKAVQEAYTGSRFYECDGGAIVMTNSTFTRGAKEAAEKTDVMLWGEIPVPGKFHFLRNLMEWILLAGLLYGLYQLLDSPTEEVRKLAEVLFISAAIAAGLLLALKLLRSSRKNQKYRKS